MGIFIYSSLLSPAVSTSRPFLKRKIALTFDDGPRPLATARLKRILKQTRAQATFFVVGRVAAKYPDVVRTLAFDGFEIANHTWNHTELRRMSPDQVFNELERTRLLIRDLTGQDTYLFRTPGSTEKFIRTHFVVPQNYTLILWDVHSLDIEGLSAEAIADRIEFVAKDGDIILMHNGLKSTADGVKSLIPRLRSRGFEFVTLSDILQYRRQNLTTAIDPVIIRG